ncbi:MAG: hypothetical protein PWP23_2405 [Candidatus Sumerlaeota bacterium]|nr:hypothetical protein [Candidatus Sumerlaeota bacterium]
MANSHSSCNLANTLAVSFISTFYYPHPEAVGFDGPSGVKCALLPAPH